MKDFYAIHIGYSKHNFYIDKRLTVLDTIKPICEAFGIDSYDYICTPNAERLIVDDTVIMCTGNSIGAVVKELIIYIFVMYGSDDLGHFKTQTLNSLKTYWMSCPSRKEDQK